MFKKSPNSSPFLYSNALKITRLMEMRKHSIGCLMYTQSAGANACRNQGCSAGGGEL
jgi:hypothetical protein